MIYFLIAAVIVVVDQISKWMIVQLMELRDSIPIIEGIFHITSHRNVGAAFGILENQRLFFIAVTSIVAIGIIYYLYKQRHSKALLVWALAIMLGGVIGNFIDRLLTGQVVDFFDVNIVLGSFFYNFPIFNIADIAICVGVGLIILDLVLSSIRESKAKKLA
ncbi:signal peptidase II [Bacillus horti]|uniref:Lipoprotein signal peptidase n=1 Tax=Caldalkalibacillus horti TaxID=77523 RepID=A0ABT9VYC3_9BACI|nr:signal peptidase II [Bacillus horti]MDQ0165889.1 signal peptidase II [Bacillus horti]